MQRDLKRHLKDMQGASNYVRLYAKVLQCLCMERNVTLMGVDVTVSITQDMKMGTAWKTSRTQHMICIPRN